MPEPGETRGRYRWLEPLGSGATATAWRAEDLETGESVVLKLGGEAMRGQLRYELERLRGLWHPRLVELLGAQWHDGAPTLVTRWVAGVPYDRWSEQADDDTRRTAVGDVLEALSFLHALGVRHGDVKPANVVVGTDGRATLIDLGCAAPMGAVLPDVSGTGAFMAPEVAEGRPADGRADLYSLGRLVEASFDTAPPWLARLVAESREERAVDAAEVLAALGREASVRAPRGHSAALHGRDTELRRLTDAAASVRAGARGSRAFRLIGPDGSGRTRLLRELAFQLGPEMRGVAVERGATRRGLGRLAGAPIAGLEEALAWRDTTNTPCVLFVDDLHLDRAGALLFSALARSAGDGPLMLVGTSRHVVEDGAVNLELAPLGVDDLAPWAAGVVDAAELARVSGGLPRRVEALLGAVLAGEVTEAELATVSGGLDAQREEELRALGALFTGAGFVSDADVERWAIPLDVLFRWQAEGAVRRDAAGWRATAAIEARTAVVRAARPFHAEKAKEATGADRAWHLARTDPEAAWRALLDRSAADPSGWARVADALPREGGDRAVAAATALADAGRARDGVQRIADALRLRPPADVRDRLRTVAAGLLVRAGEARRAAQALARVRDPSVAAEVDARVRLELGDYGGAVARAGDGAPEALSTETLSARGMARVYLGQPEGRADLEAVLARGAGGPRERVRALSFLAIADYRVGAIAAARGRYREALSIAREHRLSDQLATAALNLATADQQLGDWGAALEGYERAARLAATLERRSTQITVEHNLANLFAGVGARVRAEQHRSRVARAAADEGLAYFEAASTALRGELEDDPAAFESAREAFLALDAQREASECAVQLAGVHRRRRDLPRASHWLALVEAADAVDVRVRAEIERARVAVASGEPANAVRALETLRGPLRDAHEVHLEGELEAALAEAAAAAGLAGLADTHREAAARVFERIALGLPAPLRASFLERRRPRSATFKAPRPRLERLLAINKRLNSTLSTPRVLEHAIDAAIELTGAERGFILLAGAPLEVAAARNVDRERVGRSHLKFSHSVAARAIEEGEPLLTTDARADARFSSNASVHAMRLSSIVCVPIVAPSEVLGAIYLDNRFERGRFDEADVSVLSACADQVAIALENARLVSALEAKTEALERERQRVEELLREREAEIARLEAEVAHSPEGGLGFPAIIGRGSAMRELLSRVRRVVASPVSVVIHGESGTGKELVARAIHEHGARAERPFVAINCGALPDALLEGELFGWVRGAFTGADRDRVGLFVRATGGTVFLDEVGEMSAAMQTKLLRVLQESEVTPLGATASRSFDARVVAASNRELAGEVAAGRFREDLYYRLAVVELRVPPLRNRREDIVPLATHLLSRRAQALSLETPEVHPEAVRALLRHDWPGNVRELENVLSRALVMGDGNVIRSADLGLGVRRAPVRTRRAHAEHEEQEILRALTDTRWNVSEVSRRLGIPRTTLYRKLKQYGLDRG